MDGLIEAPKLRNSLVVARIVAPNMKTLATMDRYAAARQTTELHKNLNSYFSCRLMRMFLCSTENQLLTQKTPPLKSTTYEKLKSYFPDADVLV